MRIENVAHIPVEERHSPKGRFQVRQRHLSQALGAKKDTGTWGGGHPFDVAQARIPPGKTNWPFHSHSAQWEFFLVQSGTGEVRTAEGIHPIQPGDCFVQEPGTAHQITNPGGEDLVLLIVADNPPSDIVTYPDTGQYFLKPQRKLLKAGELPYYANEE
ncbi:MAG TPA: cupin domain-containing protein [Chthoniobacterales bacterium]